MNTNIYIIIYSPFLHCIQQHPAGKTSMKSPWALMGLSAKFLISVSS